MEIAQSVTQLQPNTARAVFIGGVVGLFVATVIQQALGVSYLTFYFVPHGSSHSVSAGYAFVLPLIGALTGTCDGFFSAYALARQRGTPKFAAGLFASGVIAGSSAIAAILSGVALLHILYILSESIQSLDLFPEVPLFAFTFLVLRSVLICGSFMLVFMPAAAVIAGIIGSLLSLFGGLTKSPLLRAIWNIIASACGSTIVVVEILVFVIRVSFD
jgi:hypothetical protein